MTNRPTLLAVSDDEWLARFILFRNQIRRDQTVKQGAFIPYPYPDLSVTRRLELTDRAVGIRARSREQRSGNFVRTS